MKLFLSLLVAQLLASTSANLRAALPLSRELANGQGKGKGKGGGGGGGGGHPNGKFRGRDCKLLAGPDCDVPLDAILADFDGCTFCPNAKGGQGQCKAYGGEEPIDPCEDDRMLKKNKPHPQGKFRGRDCKLLAGPDCTVPAGAILADFDGCTWNAEAKKGKGMCEACGGDGNDPCP